MKHRMFIIGVVFGCLISIATVCRGQQDGVVTGPVTDAIAKKLEETRRAMEKRQDQRQAEAEKRQAKRFEAIQKILDEIERRQDEQRETSTGRLSESIKALREAIEELKKQRREDQITDEQLERVSKGIMDRWRKRIDEIEKRRQDREDARERRREEREAEAERRRIEREESRERREIEREKRREERMARWETMFDSWAEFFNWEGTIIGWIWLWIRRVFWLAVIAGIVAALVYFQPYILPVYQGIVAIIKSIYGRLFKRNQST